MKRLFAMPSLRRCLTACALFALASAAHAGVTDQTYNVSGVFRRAGGDQNVSGCAFFRESGSFYVTAANTQSSISVETEAYREFNLLFFGTWTAGDYDPGQEEILVSGFHLFFGWYVSGSTSLPGDISLTFSGYRGICQVAAPSTTPRVSDARPGALPRTVPSHLPHLASPSTRRRRTQRGA